MEHLPNTSEATQEALLGKPTSPLKVSLTTAAMLLLFTTIFTGLMAAAYLNTRAPIAASAEAEKLQRVTEILPTSDFDNAPLQDAITLPASPLLGTKTPTPLYRARKGGQPAAVIFEAVAPDGYSGNIRLLLAVRANGELAGVRVVEHRETPGLGDYIDPRKDKNKTSPWIRQFDQHSLSTLPNERWTVKKDGGEFAYYTGATISARAVSKATGRAVEFATKNMAQLFATQTGSTAQQDE